MAAECPSLLWDLRGALEPRAQWEKVEDMQVWLLEIYIPRGPTMLASQISPQLLGVHVLVATSQELCGILCTLQVLMAPYSACMGAVLSKS